MMIHKIVIFDDNNGLRNSMQMLFETVPEFVVSGSFSDAENLLAKLEISLPDVILMDIDMPGINGIAAVKEVRQALPECIIIMQTIHDDESKIFESLKAGAHGYLTKDTKPAQLIEFIHQALGGGSPMTPGIARKVISHFQTQPLKDNDYNLSNREKEILQLLSDGKSHKMIAAHLYIAYETVHSHIRRIYQKLHVSSVAEALGLAFRNKLIK
jgi:DNA-binding NarL/FixJ family response regulator